jgi:polygalacturonase
VVIGSEMSGGVRNVFAHDCHFEGSDTGIRLKSNAARGGVVENIHYRDITMRDIRTDAITLITDYGAWGAAGNATHHPIFRNISIRNVTCDGARRAAIVQATAHKPVQNLLLENVSITAKSGLHFEWVQGLKLRDVTSKPAAGEPVSFKHCEQIDHVPPQARGGDPRPPAQRSRG